jgi:universal stress protein A
VAEVEIEQKETAMKVKPAKRPGEVLLEINRRDEPLLRSAGNVPFRFKRILVPIDFSDCSKKALQYALPLAEQHQAVLTLLYVVPSPFYAAGEYGGVDYASLQAEMRAGGERELAGLALDEARSEKAPETVVRTGSAAVEIVELAKRLPADLIVISTHGRSGLKHVMLGSVTEHVVRHAPCPVLVVREREQEFLAS